MYIYVHESSDVIFERVCVKCYQELTHKNRSITRHMDKALNQKTYLTSKASTRKIKIQVNYQPKINDKIYMH